MASASMQRKIEECIVQSATEYMRVREELQQNNKKASTFTLACIIGGRKEALGIPPGVEINIARNSDEISGKTQKPREKTKLQRHQCSKLSHTLLIVLIGDQLSKMAASPNYMLAGTGTCLLTHLCLVNPSWKILCCGGEAETLHFIQRGSAQHCLNRWDQGPGGDSGP
jgi:hypothetical protein